MPLRYLPPSTTALLAAIAASLLASPLLAANPVVGMAEPVRAQLISAVSAYVPGEPMPVALRLQPQPGWHTYWCNPGDSGLETRIDWQLPAGASATPIAWPLPSRFDDDGLVSFGYEGDTWLLTEITPPASAEGEFTVKASAKWLACREACIPGGGEFTLTLARAESTTPSPQAADFVAARDRMPVAVDWPAHYTIANGTVRIDLRPPAGTLPSPPTLFVAQPQLVDYAKSAELRRHAGTLSITQPLSPYFRKPPASIDLVLSLGSYGYAVRAGRSDAKPQAAHTPGNI